MLVMSGEWQSKEHLWILFEFNLLINTKSYIDLQSSALKNVNFITLLGLWGIEEAAYFFFWTEKQGTEMCPLHLTRETDSITDLLLSSILTL